MLSVNYGKLACMKQSKLGDTLRSLRTELSRREGRKISQQDVADYIGVSRAAVGQWEQGSTKNLRNDNLSGVADFFGISVDELLHRSGIENKGSVGGLSTEMPFVQSVERNDSKIEIAGYVTDHTKLIDAVSVIMERRGYIDMPLGVSNCYALEIRTSLLRPFVDDGEYLLLNTESEVSHGDDVVIHTIDNVEYVRKYLYERDGLVRLETVTLPTETTQLRRADIKDMYHVIARIPAIRKTLTVN